MIQDTSKGSMLLSGDRSLTESAHFRSYQTFHLHNNKQGIGEAFGNLYALSDDTLAGGQTLTLHVEEDSDVVLLPTVGAVQYKDSSGNETVIEAGQVQHLHTPAGTTILLINPYANCLINLLQLWYRRPAAPKGGQPMVSSFSLDDNKNQLLPLFNNNAAPRIAIGKFNGRKEVEYRHHHAAHGVYALVLEGAFEVQYRLLETRDGLALWDMAAIELEALSNDAIILLAEVQLPTAAKESFFY